MAKELVGFHRKHDRVFADLGGESLTQQHFKEECDINTIMRKYETSGLLNHINQFGGEYGDFLEAPDYHTALNQIMEAQDMFMSLPSKIRAKFGNDPEEFLVFVQDPENIEELRRLGLAKPVEPIARDEPAEKPKEAGKPPKEAPAEKAPKASPESD